ncbi:putative signal peptide-containing protein [Cryptosporidium canis]|uniref:Signal peptide-containing protein n=1 Tax=Cryptosporidium canis TaxID=195482 RepID=A0A9D5DIA0_9CRYT|nr:putative signal peptide-containing protein [Cryptosporidium canis]
MKVLSLTFLVVLLGGGWDNGGVTRVESLMGPGKRYQERERVPSNLPPAREEAPVFDRYLYSYPVDYGHYFFTKINDSGYWDHIKGKDKQIPMECWQWDHISNSWVWGPLRREDGSSLLPLNPELEAPRAYVGPTRIYGPIQVDDLPIPRVLDILCKPYESLIGIRAWFPNPDSRGRKDLRGIQFLCSSALDTRRRGGSRSSTWSKIMGNVGPNLKKYTVLTRPEDPFVKIRVFVETLNPVKHQSQRELVIPTYQGPRLVYMDNQEEALDKGPIYLIRRMTLRTKNNHLSYLGKAGGSLPSVVEEAPEGHELSGFRILISGYPRGKWRGTDFSTLAYRNSMSLGFLFSRTEDILSRPQVIYGRRGYDFQDIKCDGKITGIQGFFMGNRGLVGIKVECDRVWQDVVLGITEGTDYKALVGSMISAVTLHLSPEKFIQSLVIFSTTGRQQKLGDDWVTPAIRSSRSEGGGRRRILQGVFAELDKTGAISGIGFHWKLPPRAGEAGDREDFGNLEASESSFQGGSYDHSGDSAPMKEIVPRSSFYGRVAKDCPIEDTRCPTGVPLTGVRLIMRKGESHPKPFKMYLVSLAIQCGDEFFKPIGNPNLIEKDKKRTYDILVHEEDPIVDFRVYLGDLGLPHLFDIRFKHDMMSSYELYGFRVAMMIRSDRIGAIAPLYRAATPIDLPPITAKDISIRLFGAVRPESDPDVVVLETSCPTGIPITAIRMWFVRKTEGEKVFSRLVGLRIRCGSKWRRTKLGSSLGDRFEAEVEPGDFFSRSFVENQSEKPFYVSGVMLVTLENRKSAFGETGTEIMKRLASGDVETEIYGFIGQETAEGLVSIGFLERKASFKEYPTFSDLEVAPYQISASDIQGNSGDSLDEEERLSGGGIINFRPGEEWFGRRGLSGSHSEETFCAPGSRLTGLLVHSSTKIPHSIIGLTLICDGQPQNPVGSTLGDIARYEIPLNEPIEKVEVVLNSEDRSLSRLKLFNRSHMKKKMGKLHDRYLSGFDVEIRKGTIVALSAIYTNFGDSGPPPKVRTLPGTKQAGAGVAPLTDRNTPWGHANSEGVVSTGDEYSCEEGTRLTQVTMAYKKDPVDQRYELIGLRIACDEEEYEQVGAWEVSDDDTMVVEETFGLREKEFVIAIGGTRLDRTHSIGKLYFETNLLRQFGEWQHYYVEAKSRGDGLYGFELLFEKTGDYTTPIAMLLPLFRPAVGSKESAGEKKYVSPFELPGTAPETSEEENDREIRGMLSSPTLTTDWMGLDVGNLEMDGIWCKTSRLKLDGKMTWDDWKNSRMTGLRVYNDGDHIKGIALQCGNSWLEEANLGLVGPNFHFDEISDCLESDADYIETVEVAIDARGIPAGFKVLSHVKRQKKVLINKDSMVTWQSNAPESGNYYASGVHVEYDPDSNIIFRIRIVYRPIATTQDPEENIGFIF